jgi:hypothetical protein
MFLAHEFQPPSLLIFFVAFSTAVAVLRSHTFHNFTRRHPSFQMTGTQQQIETENEERQKKNIEKRKRSYGNVSKNQKSYEKIKIIISLD